MPYGDGILKIYSFSLTDFHDFDSCPFRFFVKHHLDRKYEIDESSPAIALGHILDQTIKNFHKEQLYGCKSSQKIKRLIRESVEKMKSKVEESHRKGKHDFMEASVPFMTEESISQAEEIFLNYYIAKKGKIREAVEEVGFCEYLIKSDSGIYKLWGGPDTLEVGDDGVPEVVDYKSRQNIENGKAYMDMDLMPKMYTLLSRERLLRKGHKKARFVVRYWQDPLDESFYEEFDLETMTEEEFLFRQKIEEIMRVTGFRMCNKKFCAACKSAKKDDFLLALEKMGYTVMQGDEFLQKDLEERTLPF